MFMLLFDRVGWLCLEFVLLGVLWLVVLLLFLVGGFWVFVFWLICSELLQLGW